MVVVVRGWEVELMFQDSGQGDLRNKILFLGILMSHKKSDLLLNRPDLLPATLPSPPAGQRQVPDQDTGDKAREPQLSCWEISSVEEEI